MILILALLSAGHLFSQSIKTIAPLTDPLTRDAWNYFIGSKGAIKFLKKHRGQLLYSEQQNFEETLKESLLEKLLNNSVIPQKELLVGSKFLKRVDKKLKALANKLSPFSIRLLNNIVLDYKPFYPTGFLDRYPDYDRANSKEVALYRNLQSTLKLSSHILHQFIKLKPDEFQKKMNQIFKQALELTATKLAYHRQHQPAQKYNKTFFSISSSQNQSSKETSAAGEDSLDTIDSSIMEKASEKVDELGI